MSFESLFTVDGVVVTENLRGQPYTLYIEDAIQETTVATGGVSAEFGRFGGGLVTAVTKSGSDRFSGTFRESINNDNWRTKTPFNEAKLDKVVPTHEYTFGGPIARRQLWFFNAGRFQDQQRSLTTQVTAIPYVRDSNEKRYEIKGTYSPRAGHSAKVAYTKIDQLVTGFSFQNIMDLRSLYNQGQPQDLLSLHYTGVLTPHLSVEGQWAQRKFTFTGAGAMSTDLVDGTLLIDRSRGGTAFRYWAPTFCGVCDDEERSNTDLIVKGSYYLSTRGGAHNIVFGVDSYNDHRFANNHQSGSDYRILGTTTIQQGADVIPVFQPNSTIIQWNPITLSGQGTSAYELVVRQRSVARQLAIHVQPRTALGWQSGRGRRWQSRFRQQQAESPALRRVRSSGRWPLVDDSQLRPVCERAQYRHRRRVRRWQPDHVSVALPGTQRSTATRVRRSRRPRRRSSGCSTGSSPMAAPPGLSASLMFPVYRRASATSSIRPT